MKVMIVVTHLLGTGHLARALTLGRAFAQARDDVTVVSGGTPVAHFDTAGVSLHQLVPLRSDGIDFTTLLRADGQQATPENLQDRRAQLTRLLTEIAPDVLITELFPFGRRILRDEFGALLEAAHAMPRPPLVLSSVRDILAPPSKPSKVDFADNLIAKYYDGVLVHSDPDVVTLDRSWPISRNLGERLHYTGFVAPPAPPPRNTDRTGIVVSAGGGAVGDTVFNAALDAAYLAPHMDWMFLVGGKESRRAALITKAPSHVRIEAPRPDFRTLLQKAAASVSMCGYNTALDVLQTAVPAVLIPFDDGGEVEQSLRADALSDQQGITVLRQDALSGRAMIKAIEDVQAATPRAPRIAGMNGALRTVEIVHNLHAGRAQ